jgi:hypothetical protein
MAGAWATNTRCISAQSWRCTSGDDSRSNAASAASAARLPNRCQLPMLAVPAGFTVADAISHW